jgi:hypothetical protein
MIFRLRNPIRVASTLLLASRQGQCANANGELYRAKETKDGNVNGESEPDVRSQYIQNLIQNDHMPNIAGPEEVATPEGREMTIVRSFSALIIFIAAGKRFDDGRIFSFQHDLSGHNGAVYSIKFNKRGNLLASGKSLGADFEANFVAVIIVTQGVLTKRSEYGTLTIWEVIMLHKIAIPSMECM